MSFVEVFPTEPVIATTRAVAPRANGAAERRERCELVVGDERRRGAARARVVEERGAAADRDEEIARCDAARVDLDAGDLGRLALEPTEAAQLLDGQRDQVRAPSVRSASRADFAIVERHRAVGELLPLLGALARDQDDVAVAGELDRAGDRARAVRLDLDGADCSGDDLVDDRLRVLAAAGCRS